MRGETGLAIAGLVTLGLGAALMWRRRSPVMAGGSGDAPPRDCGPGADILARAQGVVPSSQGDDRWQTFAPDYPPSDPAWKGTSCGYLVRWALAPWVNTRAGLEQLRTEGKKLGAWVVATPDAVPCPGSAFLLEGEGGAVMHVGIIKAYTAETVVSLDSGEGTPRTAERAEEVTRKRSVEGGKVVVEFAGKKRILAGWLDPSKLG